MKQIFCITICILILTSCERHDIKLVDRSAEFFPMQLNKFWIYNVDSISFDDVTLTSDTIHYQVKEELDSTFIDDTGNQAYRIERSRRNDTASFWTITDIWYCNLTSSTAEKVEENLRFIKLSFPMFKNKTWAGNKYIHPWDVTDYLNGWSYLCTNIDVPLTLGTLHFDSTLTVIQNADSNLTEKYFFIEKYARQVGMIYKEEQHVQKQNLDPQWTHPESGYIRRYYLIQYN